ncbi:hypothetical protein ACHAW6_000866 [Cyclotella cf. meneghiniana]
MAKSPSTLPSWNGCLRKSKNGWSEPLPLAHGSQPYWTDSLVPNSPRMSGLITSPSDMDCTLPTFLTNVTAAAQASCWSTDSAEREEGLLAFAMMMCTTNGPTYAALFSPTHE